MTLEPYPTLFQQLIHRIDRTTVMGKRNYAMLRLLWDNALRRAEVCGLDRRGRASFGWTFTLGKLGFISRARGESILQGRAAKTLADAILEPEVD